MSPWRPGSTEPPPVVASGVRVVLDARPLQDPERAPITALYLEWLLSALDADPVPGESFSFLLSLDRDDPTARWTNLEVIGRRLLPPTRLLRSGALTVDPLMLRGATAGAGWRAERGGAAGSVYHAASGALPIGSGIPVVAALLDLAPWALPDDYQRGAAARFGQRLRARILRDAAAVVVPGRAVATEARRLLHVRKDRLRVVPLAPRPAFRPEALAAGSAERTRMGLPARYAVYAGRFDARQDLPTLLEALSRLAAAPPPEGVPADAWPPRVALVGASPDDRTALSRAAVRAGVAELLAYEQGLPDDRLAGLVAGARVVLQPVRSDATGLVAMEALAAGVPVVASAVGALPDIVGTAGILVEPGDPTRLATAIAAAWTDADPYPGLVAAARDRATARRTWADVARETRAIWADVARTGPLL
ncbi:MAG TPA: glycosyltransferase [Candidatus Limnocylindrales bacterium]|nr:glycosyltransferase [Candidatus Limnocylindrales bacterium]